MADLVTLAEVKAYAVIQSNNQDSLIEDLIPKASTFVKNYCGRSFVDYYNTSKQQVFSGGNKSFFPTEMPIRDVISIEYSQDFGQTYATLVEYVDYVINNEDDTIDVTYLNAFPKGPNAYKVIYRGGYEEAPADLKQATIDVIMYYMKSDMAVKSTRSPGSSATQVEYVVNATVPSHIRRVLDYYRLIL